jgi:hypothetical protein
MSIFPYPWRPRSVWNPAKKCSGNCWIAANYTWSETNYRQSKPLKGPPNPPKSRRRPKNRLLKANGAVDLTEVTHDRPVSEKLSPPFGSAYEILGLRRDALLTSADVAFRAVKPTLNRYSCLATISLSLRDKSHSPIEAPRIKLALVYPGKRSVPPYPTMHWLPADKTMH